MNQKDKDYIEYVKHCQLVRKTMAKADQAMAKMEEQSAKEEQMQIQSDEQEELELMLKFQAFLESWRPDGLG